MINPTSIQEVMNRADLAEVVGTFVNLKRRGSNYIANCPFHNEKTPSFSLSPAKGIYKCFGCGKGGNVVTFLQDHEKLSYPESIKWLANFYKIELQETERSAEQQQQQQQEESIRVVNEFAAQWFHDALLKTEEGKTIGLSYFKERGFRQDTIQLFKLGYSPEDRSAFYQAAIAKGFAKEILEQAGLIKNRQGQYFDAYSGRVIFPIQNLTGRVLGFGARILKSNDRAPKYINSPENELYVKSKVLYGMHQARQAISKEDECLLTEGYTDVISLYQGGITNVVSSSGTSLTIDQLRLIARVTKRLVILYDGDAAGIKAAMRGLDMALQQGMNVQVVLLPEAADPDSFMKAQGEEKFRAYITANKQDMVSFRMKVGMQEVQNDPIAKSKLVNEIAQSISLLNKVEDFSLQEHYIKLASETLEVDLSGMNTLVNKFIREKISDRNKAQRKTQEASLDTETDASIQEQLATEEINYHEEQEWQLIKVLITHGEQSMDGYDHVAEFLYGQIDPELIDTELVRRLFHLYYQYITDYQVLPGLKYFIHHPDEVFQRKLSQLLQERYEVSPNWKATYDIDTFNSEHNYLDDVMSTIQYYEWKKIKAQQIFVLNKIHEEKEVMQQMKLQMAYLSLKQHEKEILKRTSTVIAKTSGS